MWQSPRAQAWAEVPARVQLPQDARPLEPQPQHGAPRRLPAALHVRAPLPEAVLPGPQPSALQAEALAT